MTFPRRCTLFAAAASPEARDWLAQVPTLPDIALGEVFAEHELVEAHGLAWAALLQQPSVRGGLGQVVAGMLEGDGARQPLAVRHVVHCCAHPPCYTVYHASWRVRVVCCRWRWRLHGRRGLA